MTINFESYSLADTERAGQKIADLLKFPACIYVSASMGMGKTTLCKSIIRYLGCDKVVTSPTYNLIQEYSVPNGMVYHMDLYRLQSPDELQYLGLADLWTDHSVFLIEWPRHGKDFLPPKTGEVTIQQTPIPQSQGGSHGRVIKYDTNVNY